MVAVYCLQDDLTALCLREALFAAGIPCALIGPTHGPVSIVYKLPFVLFAPEVENHEAPLKSKLPIAQILSFRQMNKLEFASVTVESAYLRRFGEEYAFAHADGIRFQQGRVYFRGHYLSLTATEYLIVRLLFHSHGQFFTAEEIATACLLNPKGAVAVHICNINQKARRVALHALIDSKRFVGYCIAQQ